MDTAKGHLKRFQGSKPTDKISSDQDVVFRVGEIFNIKGRRFRVEKILKKKMIVKLLPKTK